MQRRAFFKWAINGMGAVFSAVLGIPALAYLTDARNRPARESDFRTVAKLGEVPVGEPYQVLITETRRDAWNLHPDDLVGRVWLIRDPQVTDKVDAFSTVCPHLGCSVNWLTQNQEFLCPCHGGNFKKDGTRVLIPGRDNPAPRDMDSLECHVVDDPQNPGVKVVQVRYQRFKTTKKAKEVDA
jgi:menaquinol-cytochrome c reductase iron-sulfur subunit